VCRHGLALAQETEQYWSDVFLYRVRGEILLKQDPANLTRAEEAFSMAIAIAEKQKARSFGLQAALTLAKLYQSTGRSAEAHAILAPALEGFSLTQEFPAIEEAQVLLGQLVEGEEVKAESVRRRRRRKRKWARQRNRFDARCRVS
jgi:hypothetical protein